jgi:Zn-dependent protease
MKWSWKIGEFRGIGVYLHATFLLLIGLIALNYWSASSSVAKTAEGVGFIVALFGCVMLHEFGHALTAARYGIQTRDITLLPIGGIARMERMPDDPRQELWVALAGPAVNLVIAAGLYVWLRFSTGFAPLEQLTMTRGPFLERLLVANLMLFLFNLLPAFPMDGGRVLRALLATRMEYTQATQIAASFGQAMALLFGFLGFFNPILLFIALFVWIGAAQEASMAQIKSALGGIPVLRAMITDFQSISPDEPLSQAVDQILAGSQQDFPVVDNGRVVGILTRRDLLTGLAQHGPATPIRDVMQRQFEAVEPSEMLETAFRRLEGCECHTLPVVRGGALVGLITMENVGEFVAIHAAIESAPRASA